MFTPDLKSLLLAGSIGAVLSVSSLVLAADAPVRLGTPVTEAQLSVYDQQCAACHGAQGEGTQGVPALAGGTLTGTPILMTAGSYWPHASTLYDYIRRAMPPTAPKSLSNTEVYQVVAYVLHLSGIVERDFVLDASNLPQVQMPNRDGFIDRSQEQ